MTKENTNKKAMAVKDLMAMTIKVNEEVRSLISYIPADDKQFIDVAKEDKPKYYVAKLNVDFKKDEKNYTAGSKEENAKRNAEILANAKGFKAVCRDIALKAQKYENGKAFFYASACLPCPATVNENCAVCGFWVFTHKELREECLKDIQSGILSGRYAIVTGAKKSDKPLKTVLKLQKMFKSMGIELTYDEAYAKWKETK